jgi:hypothetical protein
MHCHHGRLPTNAIVVATFFVCAVSVACAILLVLELIARSAA